MYEHRYVLRQSRILESEDMKGQNTMHEDDIKAVEDAVSEKGEGEEEGTTPDVVDKVEDNTEEAD